MSLPSEASERLCALYVDMGTTNTRAWLMQGSHLLAKATAPVGIRDSARDKSTSRIRENLRDLIAKLRSENSPQCEPLCVAAAGMITSPLGLAELPHVAVPAGLELLATSAEWHRFDDVSDLPFLLVPGVRCGPASPQIRQIDAVDVMRGEETLCAGLAERELVGRPGTVINLGSHWKAIQLDAEGRICASVTSLSGELIHAAQESTILASSVAVNWPEHLSHEWLKLGMNSQRTSGLARTLFCARLLDLSHQATPEDRLAFVIGAFIASDLDAFQKRGALTSRLAVSIIGSKALAEAWQFSLNDAGIPSAIIDSATVENAFLNGLRLILEKARHSLDRSSAHNLRRTLSS